MIVYLSSRIYEICSRGEPAVQKNIGFNRDRQDPLGVLGICHVQFLKYLANTSKITILL